MENDHYNTVYKSKLKEYLPLIILVLSIFITILFSSDLIEKIDGYVPIRTNPSYLLKGVEVFVCSLLLSYLAYKHLEKYRYYVLSALSGPVLLGFLMILMSFQPGSGPIRSSEIFTINSKPSKKRDVVISVFFENGKSDLTAIELNRFEKNFEVYNTCKFDTLMVIGFASSRLFKENHYIKNRILANKRAIFVGKEIEKITNSSVVIHEWESLIEMDNSIRIEDRDLDKNLIYEKEALNRRVEIILQNATCSNYIEFLNDD